MPNRAESNRGAPKVIISMAQHASPKVTGHSDDLRVQFTRDSMLASRMPSGSFSSNPISARQSLSASIAALVPVQAAAPPHVGVGDEDRGDEQEDLDQPEQAELLVLDRVGI